jgi:hypothetical protein
MARPKGSSPHDPAAIAYAVEAVRAGRSSREIAAELAELDVHVSHMTVKRWADAAAKGESPARPAQKAGEVTGQRGASVDPALSASPSAPPPAQAPSLAERLRARAEAAPPPPADPDAPFDLEASRQRLLRQAQAEAREHELASNPKGAQAAMRRAADMVKVLAVVNKAKPADPDVLQFSRAEIDRAYAEMTSTLENLMSRPVLCSACSRELSIKFGRGQG